MEAAVKQVGRGGGVTQELETGSGLRQMLQEPYSASILAMCWSGARSSEHMPACWPVPAVTLLTTSPACPPPGRHHPPS